MIYTYRYALLGTDGRVSRETEKIDATNWLEYLKQNTTLEQRVIHHARLVIANSRGSAKVVRMREAGSSDS